MNSLWNITIQDYINIVEMARLNKKSPGDSMEEEFAEYAKLKGLKPYANTEFTKKEIIEEITSKNKTILNIETDKNGKQKSEIIKKREDLDKS